MSARLVTPVRKVRRNPAVYCSRVCGNGYFIYYARTGSLTQSRRGNTLLMRAPEPVSTLAEAPDRLAARRTRARFSILALLTAGTLINYLDRTVISVAAPLMTQELGLSAVAMGLVFSAFSWTYAAAQIPGGILLDRFGVRLTYFVSVTCWSAFTLLQGFATNLWTSHRLPHGARHRRSARLSLQQPCPRHLVSAGGARYGHRRLFDRPVFRPRVPEPVAVLDRGSVRLARAAHHRRRSRASCSASSGMRCIAIRTRAARTRPSATTSPPAAACASSSGVRFEWRHIAFLHAPAPDPRRIDRPVREQLHAGVLPHLVPYLPGDRTPDGLDQGRLLHGPAVHRRLRRRDDAAACARTSSCAARARRTSRASCPSSPGCCSPRRS